MSLLIGLSRLLVPPLATVADALRACIGRAAAPGPATPSRAAIFALTLSALLNRVPAAAQGVPASGFAIACVDPIATTLLTDDARSQRHSARWRASVRRRGRCFTIRPGEHWERIYSVGGLVIMRKTPPEPGVPPLYFRMGSLTADASDNRVGASRGGPDPGPAPAASPATQSAAPIQVEQLPPPPAPAQPAPAIRPGSAAPGGGAAAARQPIGIPAPAAPASVQPAPTASAAAGRSYAVGFVIAILLVTVLLAAAVLLMLVLLRRPANRTQQPLRSSPMPPIRPARREASAGASVPDREPTSGAHAAAGRSVPAAAMPAVLQPLDRLPLVAAWQAPAVAIDNRRQCVILLREMGWHASVQPRSGQRPANIVAERDGRLMVLHCLPATRSVDEQAVEEACMAREREQADMAVIVSNGGYSAGARQLAARIGVELLHEDELPAFAA